MNRKIIMPIFSLILVFCIIFGSINVQTAYAMNNEQIKIEETTNLAYSMEVRALYGTVDSELLYDYNGDASYLLGVTESGYAIIDRNTNNVLEYGEINPYKDFDNYKKYYGGSIFYYIETNSGYYDILRDEEVELISYFEYLDHNQVDIQQSNALPTRASVNFTSIIPNSYESIQRVAHGYNDNNTCSAIATTIALNYLDIEYNDDIVPDEYELEKLTVSERVSQYPNADAFHSFISEDCGMGAISYAQGISVPVDNYRESDEIIESTEIDVTWKLNISTDFGIDEILADKPILITSTILGDYSFHTMVAYGYRRYSDGTLEWLVHDGWHNSGQVVEDGERYKTEKWVSASTATYLYAFTFNE